MMNSIKLKGALLSVILFLMMLAVWHLATAPKSGINQPDRVSTATATSGNSEYDLLMGKGSKDMAPDQKSGFPTLTQMGRLFINNSLTLFMTKVQTIKGLGFSWLTHWLESALDFYWRS